MNRELNAKLEEVRSILEGAEDLHEASAAQQLQRIAGPGWEVHEDDEITTAVFRGPEGHSMSVTLFDLEDVLDGSMSDGMAYLSLGRDETSIARHEYDYSDLSDIKRIFNDADRLWQKKVG